MTMTLIAILIIGALIYALASNGKAAEMGRLMFACALLAICLGGASKLIHLLP